MTATSRRRPISHEPRPPARRWARAWARVRAGLARPRRAGTEATAEATAEPTDRGADRATDRTTDGGDEPAEQRRDEPEGRRRGWARRRARATPGAHLDPPRTDPPGTDLPGTDLPGTEPPGTEPPPVEAPDGADDDGGPSPEPPAWVLTGRRPDAPGPPEPEPPSAGARILRLRPRRVDGAEDPTGADHPPEVHPKIAVRRDEVADAARRRRRLVRWGSLGAAAALTAGVGVLFSPLLDVDRLEVAGVEGDPAAQVVAASGLEEGTAMFGIRAGEVRERVESLPWVAHAEVVTDWPSRVRVRVTPHRPVATVAGGDDEPAALATSSGRVLAFDDVELLVPFTSSLPVLRVPRDLADGDPPTELRGLLAVLDGLRPATVAVLGELRLGEGGLLTLVGRGPLEGAEFFLGDATELPEKSHALEAALGGSIDLSCLELIDVSVPSRMTLQRRPDCAPAEPGDGDIAGDR